MRQGTESALRRLADDGYIRRDDGRYRTTRRWQGAMARAAIRLASMNDPGDDLRVPIAHALLEAYGADISDPQLAEFITAMLPIEIDELAPRLAV